MSSYRQIFKSTAIVGGAQVIVIFLGLVRGKALALWLGTEGVGTLGIYMTALSFIGVLCSLGIAGSGVRQIGEASASGDEQKLARTVHALRITALLTGITGMIAVMVFSRQISRLVFKSEDYADGFVLLSVGLVLAGVSTGQVALLQGLRRLKEMASAQIAGGVLGTIAGLALVFWLREEGVVWSLLAVAAAAAFASWWFARRVEVQKPVMGVREYSTEARGLVAMGMGFMTANLVMAGTAVFIRTLLVHLDMGMDAAGLYQATWSLSSQYVAVVLVAMAADFAPRLTAVALDNTKVNRLVNEQMELGVLIALPGVLATLVFAPWILLVLNSSDFMDAASLVRWHMIGIFLRVVSWPLGMIIVAKGASRIFVAIELGMGLLHVALIYGCTKLWQLDGVGIAFSILYVVSFFMNWLICRRMSGYTSSPRARKIILAAGIIVLTGFLLTQSMTTAWAMGGGSVLLLATTAGCYVGLRKLLQIDPWAMLMKKLGVRKGGVASQ